MSKVKLIYFTLTEDADGSQLNGKPEWSDPSKYYNYTFLLNMNFIIVDKDGKEVETIITCLNTRRFDYNNGDPRKTNYNEEYKNLKEYKDSITIANYAVHPSL